MKGRIEITFLCFNRFKEQRVYNRFTTRNPMVVEQH